MGKDEYPSSQMEGRPQDQAWMQSSVSGTWNPGGGEGTK